MRRAGDVLALVILAAWAVPAAWQVLTSLTPADELLAAAWWPTRLSLEHYRA